MSRVYRAETGKSIEYTWNGTQLGIRIEGETDYTYVNLKGDKGDKGDTGDTGKSEVLERYSIRYQARGRCNIPVCKP